MVQNEAVSVHRCFLCGGDGELTYKSLKDFNYGLEGSFDYYHCDKCDLLWISPMPAKDRIKEFYKNFPTHDSVDSAKGPSDTGIIRSIKELIRNSVLCGHLGYRNVHKIHILCRLGQIIRFLPFIGPAAIYNLGQLLPHYDSVKDSTVIDVGCGRGEYIEILQKMGCKSLGIENDHLACQVLKGRRIPVIEGSLEDAHLPDNSAKFITMRHVIEHLPDPLNTINECFRVLSPGGRLVLHTPNLASLAHRIFKSSCYSLDPPRHLCIFSPKSMKLLGAKSDFGSCEVKTIVRRVESMFDASATIAKRGESYSARIEHHRGRRWFALRELTLCALGIPRGEEIEAVFEKGR